MQVVADSEPAAGVLQVTVPVGAVDVPAEVSYTVTVHVVVLLIATGLGVQLMLVNVERVVTVSATVPELDR